MKIKLTFIKKGIDEVEIVDEVGDDVDDEVEIVDEVRDNVDDEVDIVDVDDVESEAWYCYLLKSANNRHYRTYNGSTNNLRRRLRQHNGEIVGGAKATKRGQPWKFYAVLTGFPDKINALSCEWRIKHPTGGRRPPRFCGVDGRIMGLNQVLKLDQWTKPCRVKNSSMKLQLWILEPYDQYITNIPANLEVNILPHDAMIENLISNIT